MKDCCVVCHLETPYSREIPIAYRRFYVEGSGQLCQECHEKLYGPSLPPKPQPKKQQPKECPSCKGHNLESANLGFKTSKLRCVSCRQEFPA